MVKWKKYLCVMLSAAMMAGCVTGYGEVQADELEDTLNSQVSDNSKDDTEKEETVYVKADASGNVENITVSNWLKNTEGTDSLKDYTTLSDIENVKGYEEYVQNDDGSITWKANGADIYYQGTSDEKLPVDVKVSYKLDGADITPEELVGKSGKVTIRFDYINHTASTAKVDGKDKNVITPFVMMSGVMLPVDKFTNVQVENGKVISEGSNAIVVGYAVPGLKECLTDGIGDEELVKAIDGIDVPEYVEITADVADFSLSMTMTVGLTDVLSGEQLAMDIDLSDITNKIDTLTSSSDQLVDGSDELANGLETLKDGTYSLKTGAAQLATGADTLYAGAGDLSNGAATLNGSVGDTLIPGVNALKDGSAKLLTEGGTPLKAGAAAAKKGVYDLYAGEKKLKDGMDKVIAGYAGDGTAENVGAVKGASGLADGTKKLKTGAATLATGMGSLKTGATTLAAGTGSLKTGTKQVSDGAAALSAGAVQVSDGINKLVEVISSMPESLAAQLNASADKLLVDNHFASLEAVAQTMEQLKGAITQMASVGFDNVASDTATSTDAANTGAQFDAYMEQYTKLAQLEGSVMAIRQAAGDLSAAMQTQLDVMKGENGDITKLQAGAKAVADNSKTLAAGAGTAATGAGQVDTGANTLLTGAGSLKDGAAELAAGTDTAATGAASLSTGLNALYKGSKDVSKGLGSLMTGTNTLKTGANQLSTGASTLADKMQELYNGAAALSTGGNQLYEGTAALSAGASTLYAGAGTLKDGADTLCEGAGTLDEGAGTLKDGGTTLYEGMTKFNEEGIKKIAEMFSGDYQSDIDYIEVLFGGDTAYATYSGALDSVNTSVKFIYETGAIE